MISVVFILILLPTACCLMLYAYRYKVNNVTVEQALKILMLYLEIPTCLLSESRSLESYPYIGTYNLKSKHSLYALTSTIYISFWRRHLSWREAKRSEVTCSLTAPCILSAVPFTHSRCYNSVLPQFFSKLLVPH